VVEAFHHRFVPLYTATLPAFYIALFRNEGSLRFPKRLRLLALLAALTTGVIAIAGLPDWIKSLSHYWAAMDASRLEDRRHKRFDFMRDPRTIANLSTLLGEFSNIAYVLLLIAIFRQHGDQLETTLQFQDC
jgi:hypothetical protein